MAYDLNTQYPTLSKAPITEALIDIQTELPPDIDLAKLREFYSGLEARFPRIEERLKVSGILQLDKRSGAEMKTEGPTPDGWLMRSDESALLVQARLDGFTLNKFRPYISWASLVKEARELWERYFEIARPIKVTRLAARYINRVEMSPGVDFTEVILTRPEIAPGIPQGLPEYFVRLVIPHPSGSTAVVTQASAPVTSAQDMPAMLFDIDVFRLTQIDPNEPGAIWNSLEELRAYKNMIFFNSITPQQLDKYR